MGKHEKVSDEELVANVMQEAGAADYSGTNEVSYQRMQSTRAFHGVLSDGLKPTTGMSSMVDNKVQPAIETLTTYQANIFCSDMDTVSFSPSSKILAPASDQLTKAVNHVLHRINDGYTIFSRWIKDDAINKNGIVKVTWEEKPKSYRMEFTGNEEDISVAIDEEAAKTKTEYTILGKESETDTLEVEYKGEAYATVEEKITTVSVKFTKMMGMPQICNIPPEEFLINEGATMINGDPKTRFCCHRQVISISDIIADDRFDVDMDDLFGAQTSGFLSFQDETQNRHIFDNTYSLNGDSTIEDKGRYVEILESWIKSDRDGDGIQEWRHCFVVGNTLLYDEEWFGDIPFASFTFFPSPHKFYGQSVYDKISHYHRAASMLLRSEMDTRLLQNTYRIIADPNKVNMRDLMSNRPGIIRATDFDANTISVLPSPPGAGNTVQILEYLRNAIIGQIGIDPETGQVSADIQKSGNDAAKTSAVMDNATAKMQAFAREFAETGLKPVIWQVAQLLIEHAEDESVMKLIKKLTPDTPELLMAEEDMLEWLDKDDLSAKVGLGHRTAEQELKTALTVIKDHAELEANPTNPVNIPYKYKLAAREELMKASKYDDVSRFYPSAEEMEAASAKKAQALQQAQQEMKVKEDAEMQDGFANSEAKRKLEEAQAKMATVKADAAEREQALLEELEAMKIANIDEDNKRETRRLEGQEEQMAENIDARERKDEQDMEIANIKAETAIKVAEIQAQASAKKGGSE